MDKNELYHIMEQIEGYLSFSEGELLYQLANKCTGKGVIVEIGSWKGKSTVCLGLGSKNGNQVNIHAIDPHTGNFVQQAQWGEIWTFTEFSNNINRMKLADIIIPIVQTSELAVQNFTLPVELLFIDGEHERGFPQKDFELWSPKLISGGIIAFHDATCWPEPKAVMEENIYNSTLYKDIGIVDSIVYATKN